MSVNYQLSPELRAILQGELNAYLKAPKLETGKTPVETQVDWDRRRIELINNSLKPLLQNYFAGSIQLSEFKRSVDSTNKQNQLWGFSGIKGQMFFNMLVKTAEDVERVDELDRNLKAAIMQPPNELAAAESLKTFTRYVGQLGKMFVERGGPSHSKPKIGSVPFFVSYFWQIEQPAVWPVFYTNTVQMIESMNLWQERGEPADDYLTYKNLHESLATFFSKIAGRPFSLYDVEHVFWFKSGKMLAGSSAQRLPATDAKVPNTQDISQPELASILPGSFVPPIVEIIPKLALNDLAIQEVAKRSGTTPQLALEKSIHAAFTMLGYETRGLGQGMGRVPDGQAIATEESYAVLWDAKARADGYRMGTDDRAIRQYIEKQSRTLRGIRNIYFLIISSRFADEFEELIRSLKMETDVNEVCLVEADALVAVVEQRLRAPLEISLGPDGIQRLFSSSGVITAAKVMEVLG